MLDDHKNDHFAALDLQSSFLFFVGGGNAPKPNVEEISSEVFFMGGIENSGFLVQVGEEVERALKNFTPKVGSW
jgi:hypothetical protein